MAVETHLAGINVFQSRKQYDSNVDKIKENEINLIKDDAQYLTVENLKELKDELKGDKGDPGENGMPGLPGKDGAPGKDGEPGATFTPSVSEDGIFSFTNDKGLPNPDPVRVVPILSDEIKKEIALLAHPVGSYYQSDDPTDPSILFGGTWQAIRGVFLFSETDERPNGSTGGEESHTLSIDEMPEHNHKASSDSQGEHTHTASTNSTGGHSHTRGSMNISGKYSSEGLMRDIAKIDASGCFYESGHTNHAGWGYGGAGYPLSKGIGFDASRNWSGSTSTNGAHSHTVTVNSNGAHTHTVTVDNSGGGQAHNNMPPYKSVYTWKRIS